MELSRRSFLKGALTGGAVTTAFGFDVQPALAQSRELKIARTTETRSICPYCAEENYEFACVLGKRRTINVSMNPTASNTAST